MSQTFRRYIDYRAKNLTITAYSCSKKDEKCIQLNIEDSRGFALANLSEVQIRDLVNSLQLILDEKVTTTGWEEKYHYTLTFDGKKLKF